MDEKLKAIVQRMIDAGEPEANIQKVIQNYKPEVKKKDVSQISSPDPAVDPAPLQATQVPQVGLESESLSDQSLLASNTPSTGLEADESAPELPIGIAPVDTENPYVSPQEEFLKSGGITNQVQESLDQSLQDSEALPEIPFNETEDPSVITQSDLQQQGLIPQSETTQIQKPVIEGLDKEDNLIGKNAFLDKIMPSAISKIKQDDKAVAQRKAQGKLDEESTAPGTSVFKAFTKGSADLGVMLANTPKQIYNLAAVPQNFVAEKFPESLGWLATNSDKFAEMANLPDNEVSKWYEERSEELDKNIIRHEGGILENIQEGNYSNALTNLTTSITESLPITLGMMATGAAGVSTRSSIAGGSLVFGAGKAKELEDRDDLTDSEKAMISTASGAMEGLWESIGTGTIGKIYSKTIAKEGLETGAKKSKDLILKSLQEAVEKNPTLAGAPLESFTEMMTQYTQNIIDKVGGVNPDLDVMEGVFDAGITGMAMGPVLTAPASIAKLTKKDISDLQSVKMTHTNVDGLVKEAIEKGVITSDQAKEFKENIIENVTAANKMSKGNVPEGKEAEVHSLLKEKSKLEADKKGLDDVVAETKNKEIEEVNEKLRSELGLETKEKKESSEGTQTEIDFDAKPDTKEQETETVPEQRTEIPAGKKLFNDPNPETADISKKYKEDKGIDFDAGEKIQDIDVDRSRTIADAYDKMEDNPSDPEVQEAYNSMAEETMEQHKYMQDSGYEIEIFEGEGEPYANSEEMIKDLKENKHMFVFSTEAGFGDSGITEKQRGENALLGDSGVKDKNGKTLLVNDVFRGVHDFFGHSERGNSFGAKGEENAWDVHARMFTDKARRAMTSETRGQNSWVNFGPQMRNEDGSLKKKGDEGYLEPKDRAFADQKMGLLPVEFSNIDAKPKKKATETKAKPAKVEATKKVEKQPESKPEAPVEVKDKKAARAEAAKKKRAEKKVKKKDDKGDKPSPKSIKKQNISDIDKISTEGRAEEQVKAVKSVKNVVKAISGIDKDVEFIIHEENDSYTKAVKEAGGQESDGMTSGFFDDAGGSKIHINVSQAQSNTAFHEGAHKVMGSYLKRNPKATGEFYEQLKKSLSSKDRKSLNEFASNYNTTLNEVAGDFDTSTDSINSKIKENKETVRDEFVTEALARIANGDVKLNRSALKKIKEMLIKLAKTLGFDPKVIKLTGKEDIQDFARKLSEAFNEGKVIEINDLKAIKEGASTYVSGPVDIKTQKAKREKVVVNKDGHALSFVSESDIIDIEALMSDISDKGEKVWFWVADQLGRGMYSDTVLGEDHYLDAGPSYALDPKNKKENIIWATGKNEKEVTRLIDKSDYIFIISGSPEKSKLFNSRVFNLLEKRIASEGGYSKFKKDVLKVSKVSKINNILKKYDSLEDLAASPERKDFMIELLNQESKKTPLRDVLGSYNSFIDLNELRDGFYADNNFELNDVMLVLKPESFGGESSHSTYQNDIIGKVIGVPDKKVNAYNILPKEVRDNVEARTAAKNVERKAEGKKTRELGQSAKQQVVAPYGIGVKKIDPKKDITDKDLKSNGIEPGMKTSPVETPKFQKNPKKGDDLVKDFAKVSRFDMFNHVTEDSEGNYLFFHYSPTKFEGSKIDPKFFKKNSTITTDKRMHKISMFYTKPGDREGMVGSEANVKTVKIPKNKVYPLQSDPLDFYDEAEKMFREEFDSETLDFSPHWQASYIGKVAKENGFDMLISTWDGLGKKGLRGESQIPNGFTEGVPVDAKKPVKFQKSSDEDVNDANDFIKELKDSGELSDYNNGELVDTLQDIFELDTKTAQEVADKAIPPTGDSKKKRAFSERVSGEVQKGIDEEGKNYIPITNSATIEEINELLKVKDNATAAVDVLDFKNGMSPATRVMYASALVKRLEKDGDLDLAAKVAGGIAKYGTELGQGIQAFSVFNGLTVPGLIAYYDSQTKIARGALRKKKKKLYKGVKSGYKKGTKNAAKKAAKKVSSKSAVFNLNKKDITAEKSTALNKFKSLMGKKPGSGDAKFQVTSLPSDAEAALSDYGFLIFAEGTRDYDSWKAQMIKDTEYDNESDLKKIWDKGENELGQTLSTLSELSDLEKVVLNHFSSKIETPLSKKLEDSFGIDKTTAVSLAKEIEAEFNKIVKEERSKAIKSDTGLTTTKSKKAIKEVVEKDNLSDTDIDSVIDKEFKVEDLTPAEKEKLAKLGKERDARPEGYLESEKTIEMMSMLESRGKINKGDLFFALWYSSVLSGPQTQFLNFFANSMNIAMEQGVTAIEQAVVNKNSKAIPQAIVGLLKGMKKGGDEMAQTLKTGQAPSKTTSKIETPGILEERTFKGGKFNPINYYKYVGRFMSAIDAAAYVAVQNSMTRELASEIAKNEGLTKQEFRDRVEHLSGSKEAREDALVQAETEIDAIEESEGKFSKMERNRRIRSRASEIVESQLDPDIAEGAKSFAEFVTFNYKPRGRMGYIAELLSTAGQKIPAFKLVVPFTNIVANVLNQQLDYTPYGLYRAGRSRVKGIDPKSSDVIQSEKQRNRTAIKSVMGTTMMTGLYLMVLAAREEDEENPWFDITGKGPADYNKRNQEFNRGWKPFSIKIGDTYISYQYTPMGAGLSWLGNWADNEKYKDLESKDMMTKMAYGMSSAAQSITEMSFLTGLAGLFEFLTSESDPERNAEKLIKSSVLIPGSFIPNLFKQTDKFFAPDLYETRDIQSALINEVPILRHTGGNKEKLNILGDSVEKTGNRFYTVSDNIDPIFTMFADKGYFAPGTSTHQKLGDYSIKGEDNTSDMTDDEFREYIKISGGNIKKRINEDMDELKKLSKEDFKEDVHKIFKEERKFAKMDLDDKRYDKSKNLNK